jgi:hypothetical protein
VEDCIAQPPYEYVNIEVKEDGRLVLFTGPRGKPGRPRRLKKVEDCIAQPPYEYVNIEVKEDGRLVLFTDEYQNSITGVWV